MQYFNEKDKVNVEDIEKVAKGILEGKIAIFPTETVYGIGANAFDKQACERIFEVKGRPNDKPLIVLISDLEMLNLLVERINEIERKLIEAFWPGPLTIIFDKKENSQISDVVTAKKSTIGVRMTSGEIAKMLVKKAGVPIVAPSANLSGMRAGIKMEEILNSIGNKVDYIIDSGNLENKKESTIVKVEKDIIYILREGVIKKQELEKIAIVKYK